MPLKPPTAHGSQRTMQATGIVGTNGHVTIDLARQGFTVPKGKQWVLIWVTTYSKSTAVAPHLEVYKSDKDPGNFIAATDLAIDTAEGAPVTMEPTEHLVGVYSGYASDDVITLTGHFIEEALAIAETVTADLPPGAQPVEGPRSYRP